MRRGRAGYLHSRAGQDRRGGRCARRARPGTATARQGCLAALLGYTPGPASLAAVVKAMGDNDTEVHQAAFRTLVGWPDATALPQLVDVARRAPDSADAIVALRDGCLRLGATKKCYIGQRGSFEFRKNILSYENEVHLIAARQFQEYSFVVL